MREQCLPVHQQPPGSSCCSSLLAGGFRPTTQVNKEWDINKETMDTYVAETRKLENKFSGLEIHHIVRDNNVGADVLSKLVSERVLAVDFDDFYCQHSFGFHAFGTILL